MSSLSGLIKLANRGGSFRWFIFTRFSDSEPSLIHVCKNSRVPHPEASKTFRFAASAIAFKAPGNKRQLSGYTWLWIGLKVGTEDISTPAGFNIRANSSKHCHG